MSQVSIIVPVYNVEKYLGRCIESILGQTFTDFELILVDDGSPDGCPAICDEYAAKDNRIVVIHKENGGVSKARNAALDIAKGEHIAFCDSDDWYDSTMIEELYTTMIMDESDGVVCGYRRVLATGEVESEYYPKEKTPIDIMSAQQKLLFYTNIFFRYRVGYEVWNRLYKSEIIQKHRIRFCETCNNFAEDIGFNAKYALYARRLSQVQKIRYNYYERKDSIVTQSKGRLWLHELNEVSYDFERELIKAKDKELKKAFPIIHFNFMMNQYGQSIGSKKSYLRLMKELDSIQRQRWYRMKTNAILLCYKQLLHHYTTTEARKILLISHYLTHRNWKLFSIESAIFYKFFNDTM